MPEIGLQGDRRRTGEEVLGLRGPRRTAWQTARRAEGFPFSTQNCALRDSPTKAPHHPGPLLPSHSRPAGRRGRKPKPRHREPVGRHSCSPGWKPAEPVRTRGWNAVRNPSPSGPVACARQATGPRRSADRLSNLCDRADLWPEGRLDTRPPGWIQLSKSLLLPWTPRLLAGRGQPGERHPTPGPTEKGNLLERYSWNRRLLRNSQGESGSISTSRSASRCSYEEADRRHPDSGRKIETIRRS
jgi:hypothetical protein